MTDVRRSLVGAVEARLPGTEPFREERWLVPRDDGGDGDEADESGIVCIRGTVGSN